MKGKGCEMKTSVKQGSFLAWGGGGELTTDGQAGESGSKGCSWTNEDDHHVERNSADRSHVTHEEKKTGSHFLLRKSYFTITAFAGFLLH